MTTNTELKFRNQIQFEVFAQCSTKLVVQVDGVEHFNKNFEADKKYIEKLDFYHSYKDGGRSNLEFLFTGEKEVAKKYIKINSIYINNTYISQLQGYYYPDINPEWWDSLSKKQQQEMNDVIYINSGGHYGWYGRIKYELRTVKDSNSHYLNSINPEYNIDRLIGRSNTMNMIFRNLRNNKAPWSQKRDSS